MKISFIFLTMLLPISAVAAPGTTGKISFSGNFTGSPCEVKINNSSTSGETAEVLLDNWNLDNYLNNIGSTTALKKIDLDLINCPAGQNTATIRFLGVVNNENSSIFKIKDEGKNGAADGMGIALYNSNDTADILKPNVDNLELKLINGQSKKVIYASYKMTKNKIKAGAANTVLTLDISYK